MRACVAVSLILAGMQVSAGGTPQAPPSAQTPGPATRDVAAFPARRLGVLADRRYTMHAGIRPLYLFWIRRDNVGSARVWWRQAEDGSRGFEMIVGSDPKRAPRKVNKWGYFSEELTPAGTTVLGIMKTSDEETLTEAERAVAREGENGTGFRYKAIRSEVVADRGRTGVFRMVVGRDLTYREVEELLSLMPREVPINREYRLPAGVRGGYLGTMSELIAASAQWYRTKGATPRVEGRGLRYMFNGDPYEMVLRSSKFVPRARCKSSSWANVVEGQFRITNQLTGFKTDFRLDYVTEGPLAEVPVHVVFQPKWWLEVELVLDPEGVY
jgi:hypothetical protein